MADTQPISAKITAASQKGDGFKVEGFDNWFNLTNDYQGILIPPVGTEIEFKYKPWMNPKSHKTAYYVDEIIPVSQVGAPQAAAPPQSLAGPHVAPTPAPVAQAPRNGPESLSQDAGPVLGTHAYTDLSIQRQVALKAAVETLNHCEGKYTDLATASDSVLFLAEKYGEFLNGSIAGVAMPDDTLVPTPSEMSEPGPEYTG